MQNEKPATNTSIGDGIYTQSSNNQSEYNSIDKWLILSCLLLIGEKETWDKERKRKELAGTRFMKSFTF